MLDEVWLNGPEFTDETLANNTVVNDNNNKHHTNVHNALLLESRPIDLPVYQHNGKNKLMY